MLDFLHLPKPQNGTIDYFPGFSNTAGGSWEVWNKPRNCMFIRILCIGGGGGGGRGGAANGAATSAGGGGGGGTSGMTVSTIPAVFVPDRLYVSSGTGGAGGSAGAGSAGIASRVSIAQSTAAIYAVCIANGGGGGSAGSNTTTTGGSGGGTVTSNSSGSAGNVNAPASQTSVYTLFQTLTAVAFSNGKAGVELYQPLMSCGGVGGGAALNGGHNGGAGGFGSGGGGGGAAVTTGASGGAGGDGGSGLVVIQTW